MSDYPAAFTSSKPKAIKRHRCCECNGFIEVGEIYHKFSGVWDGRAETFKTCSDCQEWRGEIREKIAINERQHDERLAFENLHIWIASKDDVKRSDQIRFKRGRIICPDMKWRDAI